MKIVLYVYMLIGGGYEYNWVPNGEFENAVLCEIAGNEMYRKDKYKCIQVRY